MTPLAFDPPVFLGAFAGTILGFMMGVLSLFLILLVLVQRGRGGGLTGALGGPGGQSAFGSKAGDTFTVITVVVAAIWAFTCAFTMWLLGTHTPVAVNDPPSITGDVDEDAETDTLTIPAGDSFGLSGMTAGDEPDADDGEANNVELTPADGADDSADDGETTPSEVDEMSLDADEAEATETTEASDEDADDAEEQ